jgi:hypothetical protein
VNIDSFPITRVIKLLLPFIGVLLFFESCNKPYLLSEAGASFKIDNIEYKFSAVFDQSRFDTSAGRWYGCYYLKSSGSGAYLITADDGVNSMIININAPSGLSIGAYNEVQVNGFFRVNGISYLPGQITVNIIRNHNGTIDGTFSARVGDFNGNIKTVTDGHFFNFKKSL